MASDDRIKVAVLVEAGGDERERDELTAKLRRELLRLDVDAVERLSAGDAPPGARAVDLVALGTLIVTISKGAAAIAPLIAAIRSWLTTRGGGTVKVQIGSDTIEVTGTDLSDEQKALVAMWTRGTKRRESRCRVSGWRCSCRRIPTPTRS